MPLLASLLDNFDDNSLDAAKWTKTEATGNSHVQEQNQRLEYSGSAYGDDSQLDDVPGPFDASASSVFFKKIGSAGNNVFQLRLIDPSGDEYRIDDDQNSLSLNKVISGVGSQVGGSYTTSDYAWFRLRFASGNVKLDTAPSTAADPPAPGDWTNRVDAAIDAGFDATSVRVRPYWHPRDAGHYYLDGFSTGTVGANAPKESQRVFGRKARARTKVSRRPQGAQLLRHLRNGIVYVARPQSQRIFGLNRRRARVKVSRRPRGARLLLHLRNGTTAVARPQSQRVFGLNRRRARTKVSQRPQGAQLLYGFTLPITVRASWQTLKSTRPHPRGRQRGGLRMARILRPTYVFGAAPVTSLLRTWASLRTWAGTLLFGGKQTWTGRRDF